MWHGWVAQFHLSIWVYSNSKHGMLTVLPGRILRSYHTRTIGSRKRSIIIWPNNTLRIEFEALLGKWHKHPSPAKPFYRIESTNGGSAPMCSLLLRFGDQHSQFRNVHFLNQRAISISFGYIYQLCRGPWQLSKEAVVNLRIHGFSRDHVLPTCYSGRLSAGCSLCNYLKHMLWRFICSSKLLPPSIGPASSKDSIF